MFRRLRFVSFFGACYVAFNRMLLKLPNAVVPPSLSNATLLRDPTALLFSQELWTDPVLLFSNSDNNENDNDDDIRLGLLPDSYDNDDVLDYNDNEESSLLSSITSIPKPDCYTTDSGKQYCCATSWDHNLDEWWQRHPDWDISQETDETYCFSPLADPDRATFLRDTVYPLQWESCGDDNKTNCFAHFVINSGYSANLGLLGMSFMTAVFRNHSAFCLSKKYQDQMWRYSNQIDANGTGHSVCPSGGMDCFFLPITNCEAKLKQHNGLDMNTVSSYGSRFDAPHITWLRQYLTRPQLWLRHQVYKLRKPILNQLLNKSSSCTVLHVRRTDVLLEGNWKKRRHYFALSDYLEGAARRPDKNADRNILLLTDDQSTIDELHQYYNDTADSTQWTYLPRFRWRGTEGGLNGHLPSGDVKQEMVHLLTELSLASHCKRLIHSKSGFSQLIKQYMRVGNGTEEWYRRDVSFVEIGGKGKQPNATYTMSEEEFFHQVKQRHKKKGSSRL